MICLCQNLVPMVDICFIKSNNILKNDLYLKNYYDMLPVK